MKTKKLSKSIEANSHRTVLLEFSTKTNSDSYRSRTPNSFSLGKWLFFSGRKIAAREENFDSPSFMCSEGKSPSHGTQLKLFLLPDIEKFLFYSSPLLPFKTKEGRKTTIPLEMQLMFYVSCQEAICASRL